MPDHPESSRAKQTNWSDSANRFRSTPSSATDGRCKFLLGPGIAPENIRDSDDGFRRDIILWPDWTVIRDSLDPFQSLLAIVANPITIFGFVIPKADLRRGIFQKSKTALHGGIQFNPDGMAFRASEVVGNGGRRFSISAYDRHGAAQFKLCLTPGASLRAFEKVVQRNQGIGCDFALANCTSEPGVTETSDDWIQPNLIPTLPDDLSAESLFRFWMDAGIRIVISTGNSSASVTAAMVPREIRDSNDGEWLYVGDHERGLHLNGCELGSPTCHLGTVDSGEFYFTQPGQSHPLRIQATGLA